MKQLPLTGRWRIFLADIIVTGHRNPDMDSVCSAWAYAHLKNRLADGNRYIPIRLGSLNRSTRAVFDRLGVKPPVRRIDVTPRVSDVAKRDILTMDINDPVFLALKQLDEQNISLIPVFRDGNTFQGTISSHEITRFLMTENCGKRPVYHFRVSNFPEVVPGYFYTRGQEIEFEAPLMTGAMPYELSVERIRELEPLKPVLVMGLREDLLQFAIEQQFPAIILTGLSGDKSIPVKTSGYRGTIFISQTDTAETIRLLRLSAPVKGVLNKNPHRLPANETFDKAKKTLVESSDRGLPVFEGEEFAGIVTRRCFIEKPMPKLILVDHNELSQSVHGAEQGEVLEILDHHRLGMSKTREPIYVYSRPLGSTCTIVFYHYHLYDMEISREEAGILLAGLLSDTVLLRSPTTTDEDRSAVKELSRISGLDVESFGQEIFSHTIKLSKEDPAKIVSSDFKIYDESGIYLGISQVEVTGFSGLEKVQSSYLKALEDLRQDKRLNWAMLLVTDVLQETSRLLCTSFPDVESLIPWDRREDRVYNLPGILSRKKQLLPEILRILDESRE